MTNKKLAFMAIPALAAIMLGVTVAPLAFAGVTQPNTITVDVITSPTTDTEPTFAGTVSPPPPSTTTGYVVGVTSSIDGILGGSDVCGTDGSCGPSTAGDWKISSLAFPLSVGTHTLTFELSDDSAPPVVRELVIETTLSTQEQIEEIIEDVNALNDPDLKNGNINSLNKKLENAIKNITNEDPTDDAEACEKLQSFIDQLNAFVNSGKLDQGQIDPLVDAAQSLIDDLC